MLWGRLINNLPGNVLPCMESEGSLQSLQERSTGPYPIYTVEQISSLVSVLLN